VSAPTPPLSPVVVALLAGGAAEHLVPARLVPAAAVVELPEVPQLFGLVEGDDPVAPESLAHSHFARGRHQPVHLQVHGAQQGTEAEGTVEGWVVRSDE
jgi:hypothetical protein